MPGCRMVPPRPSTRTRPAMSATGRYPASYAAASQNTTRAAGTSRAVAYEAIAPERLAEQLRGPSSRTCPARRRTCTARRARPGSASPAAESTACSPAAATAARTSGTAPATVRTRRTTGPAGRPTAAAAVRAPGSPRPDRPGAVRASAVGLVIGVAGQQRPPVEVVEVGVAARRSRPGQRFAEHVADATAAQRGELAEPAEVLRDPLVHRVGGQPGERRVVEQARPASRRRPSRPASR